MRIGVNTRFLIKDKLEGIGWFTYEVLKRWVVDHPEHDFVFFFDRPYSKDFVFAPNVKPVVVFPPARAIPLWKIWFNWSLPYYCKKEQVDVLVSPDGYASLNLSVPQLLVIHDLAFEHADFGLAPKYIRYYQKYTPKFAQVANRIATVSEFTKQDIQNRYAIEGSKIDVVYNGYNEAFQPLEVPEKEAIRNEYSDGIPYFVNVGAIHPRKNGLRLLQAFEAFKQQTKSKHKLIFIGRKAWSNKSFDEYYEQMTAKQDVILLGHLGFEALKKVLAAADVLYYPSLFEGFGIPIVEAFACNVPVVTSNTSSMKEVGGDAAELVDPNSVKSILESMLKIYNNIDINEIMINKGGFEKGKYSWNNTAQRLWLSLEKMMKNEE